MAECIEDAKIRAQTPTNELPKKPSRPINKPIASSTTNKGITTTTTTTTTAASTATTRANRPIVKKEIKKEIAKEKEREKEIEPSSVVYSPKRAVRHPTYAPPPDIDQTPLPPTDGM